MSYLTFAYVLSLSFLNSNFIPSISILLSFSLLFSFVLNVLYQGNSLFTITPLMAYRPLLISCWRSYFKGCSHLTWFFSLLLVIISSLSINTLFPYYPISTICVVSFLSPPYSQTPSWCVCVYMRFGTQVCLSIVQAGLLSVKHQKNQDLSLVLYIGEF